MRALRRDQVVSTTRLQEAPSMRLRVLAAAAVVASLVLAAFTASSGTARPLSPARAHATGITVWLMSDAQSNWPEAVAAATKAFQAKHPGTDVTVQYQGWGRSEERRVGKECRSRWAPE